MASINSSTRSRRLPKHAGCWDVARKKPAGRARTLCRDGGISDGWRGGALALSMHRTGGQDGKWLWLSKGVGPRSGADADWRAARPSAGSVELHGQFAETLDMALHDIA